MEYPSEEKLRELALKWLNGSLTPEEEALFNQWYDQLPPSEIEVISHDANAEAFKERVYQRVMTSIHPKGNVIAVHKRRWIAWSTAAAVALTFGLVAYFTLQKTSTHPTATIATGRIAPGGNRAVLTLENGQQVDLGRTGKNQLPDQGNTQIINSGDGMLTYQTAKSNPGAAIAYNTLSTPTGGQYQLLLPDGTKVWLNSSSTIRYPVNFSGDKRVVSITGEAYFEVKHNARMPFAVKVGNTIIHDIGTHFDINAYSNEPDLKVTLAEGSVEVEQTVLKTRQLMQPGEQVSIDRQGIMKMVKDFDVEKAIAWKDGLFVFDGEKLATVMRQIARWYDVDVEYPDGIPDIQFTGSIHRDVDASQVLDMLGYFKIKFKIVQDGDRKKIIVEP